MVVPFNSRLRSSPPRGAADSEEKMGQNWTIEEQAGHVNSL